MHKSSTPSAIICELCGGLFTLPVQSEVDGNLPRLLLCGHIFCTSCLQTIQCNSVITCPECEVETTLPEGGVYSLQEDSRITGLIYTAEMNKKKRSRNHRRRKSSTDSNANSVEMEQTADIKEIEKTLDDALAQAAKNFAQLENIHETLSTGLTEQVKRERARLEMEIKQAADKAVHAVQKWRDVQLSWLTKLEAQFGSSQAEVACVQERMKTLQLAMQMARQVRRVPFLEQYCTLDKVLENLQAPVDNQPVDVKFITKGSGMSCVFQSEALNQSLTLSLKMEVSSLQHLSMSPPKDSQPGSDSGKSPLEHAEDRNSSCSSPRCNKLPSPQEQDNGSPEGFCCEPRLLGLPHHSSCSDIGSPDLIIEEVLYKEQEHTFSPTGHKLSNDKWRIPRRRRDQPCDDNRSVTHWVFVTHIENPSHFYIRYVGEKRRSISLSKKINYLCSRDDCHFTSSDVVETDSLIFVKWKEELWCRANVVEVLENGRADGVKSCKVTRLAGVRVFFLDHGFTKSLTIQSEEGTTKSSLRAVNNHMRRMNGAARADLAGFAPRAIRCSLKDLVPYGLTSGWSNEAKDEFRSLVSTEVVEMRVLGQDTDSLLVDLRKVPMDQSSDVPISVREFLVFIEVARFYSPVTLNRKPQLYYPPVYPKLDMELSAVVAHVSNPADFYIQLVDNMESLLLSAKLQECYSAGTLPGQDDLKIYCPVIGQACVARFDDKLWYRAQVIAHPGDRKVKVRFVDFGNYKILPVSDLRKIKDEFFALPSMAIHCCLLDVVPLDGETWSEACTDRFISLAHQKLLTIVATGGVPESKPLPVRLFESSLNGPRVDISELLVSEQLACFREGHKPMNVRPVEEDAAIWDPPLELGPAADGEQDEELLEFQPHLKLPVQLKDLKVRVSHVNSPSSFYVQLTQHDSHLKRICELVKQECVLTEPRAVEWKADMYCAAHINGLWERGRIRSVVTSGDTAEVMRCDHGNVVKLHVSNLRPLPSSLTGSLALECTLTDIRPAGGQSTWTATACDLISFYLTGASALMTIKEATDERPVPVTLFCSNKTGQFVSVADFLASEGLALRERKPRDYVCQKPIPTDAEASAGETQTLCCDGEKKDTTPTPQPAPPLSPSPTQSSLASAPPRPKPAPRTIMTVEKVTTGLYQSPELPRLGHIQMTVSSIGDDGLIYARAQNAECQLEQLRQRIQQSLKTLPRQKSYTWKSVLGCAVIGPDMLWYRGQVLEVLGGHVKVQYVDYGLVEHIPVVHVYPTLLCEDVPQLCVPCQLHGIHPVGGGWQQDAVALLRELLLNRCVDMQVMDLPADPRDSLTVEIFLDGMSLSRILCHHEHATLDQTVSAQAPSAMSPAPLLDDWDMDTEGLGEPEDPTPVPFILSDLPQDGQQFQVTVKHLWTPNKLFLWPVEGTADVKVNGEGLFDALGRINTNIDSVPRLTSFPQGGPCLAEYSDGRYYRAKLLKITNVEPVTILVHHVDFGSDDTVPASRLRQMPAELLRFPIRGFQVKVAGFKAPSVNRREDALPYCPEWSVAAAQDMISLLHGDVTATVVAREPELTVLLHNADGEPVHLPLVMSGLAELE